jgi:putative ABC transport system permease protein
MLENYPATYLTSFYVPPEDKSRLSALIHTFPTIIFIDLASMLDEVQKLLAQVSQGVQVILVFILCAGVLVLLASIAASLDTRRQEAALLRALGASRWQLQQRAGLELFTLGLLAGLLAIVMTEIIAAGLAVQLLESTPRLHPLLWLLTPLATGTLTLSIGLLSLRRVWTVSPMVVLREV